MLYCPIKSIFVNATKSGSIRWWQAVLNGKKTQFIDPGFEPLTRSGNREPGNQCLAGLPGPSGTGWRSCQGPDSVSTSNGQLGQQHKGG